MYKSLFRPGKGLEPEFELWAFGPGPFESMGLDRLRAWNDHHGEISGLILHGDGNFMEDLMVMRTIWEFYKDKGIYPCLKD